MIMKRIDNSDVVAVGSRIYDEKVLSQIKPKDHGRFAIIDVNTANFVIADSDLEGTMKLLAQNPQAMTYGVKIGFDVPYKIGGIL